MSNPVPAGERITLSSGTLTVPDRPVIPFIEGDGTGRDIWRASQAVFDAAVAKAYGGKRSIAWMEVLAGEKAFKQTKNWLPDETIEAFRKYLVGIKGPLTTPIGGGIRSLNVALRQLLDLYVCLRPVRYFKGVPEPGEAPGEGGHGDLPREHRGHLRGHRVRGGLGGGDEPSWPCSASDFPKEFKKIRFPQECGIGIKAVSREGSERLIRAAIQYALEHKRKSVTFVHKGNIMKFTEGAFRNWGYALAEREFADKVYTWEQWEKTKAKKGEDAANAEQKAALASGKLLIKDAIADITLQQVLTRPDEFDVIATLNLNGDYLSRRARGAGRRHRHRARRQHQLRHRPRGLRGDARHGAQVRGPGQGEPGLGHPLRRDDAPPPGLERGGRPHHQGHGRRHRAQDRDLRLRPADEEEGQGEVTEVKCSEFGQAIIKHM